MLLDGCVFPFHPVLGAPPDAMADALREVLAFYPSGSSEHPSGRLAPDDIVFIDVETTGLSGGAGTYPFLVGVGRMELGKNAFVIEQLFMEDYDQERAQLAALADRVADAGAIVTFNGRSFDIPLLCNRLIFHRMNHRLLEKPHADLLHPARRLWRRRLPSCTLQALEAELFGLRREGDVPGEMIPQIFFDYVRGRRPEAIAPVIAHNAQDVVTMAGLLLLIGGLIARAENLPDGFGHELLGLARMLNRRGERRRAAACRERAAGDLTEPDLQAAALFDLGLDYKRMEQWRDALEAFESAARIAPPELSLRARVEMSKIYEHRTHQHADALRTVNAALDYLQQHRELLFYTTGGMADDADHTDLWTAWRNALLHRRTRLQKKLARCEVVS
ncbi:MAG: metal-dependent exonucleaseMrfB [Candidatus Sumerlaeia bacterium]